MTLPANDGGTPRFLDAYLAPLAALLEQGDVTDLFINRPGEVWIERISGGCERHTVAGLDEAGLWRLARQIASLNHQGISREYPLLAASLPDGARVQVVAPPATRGGVVIAIRKHLLPDLTLSDYVKQGAFSTARFNRGAADLHAVDAPDGHDSAALARFLAELVKARRNILISGGTSSGKTTFLNALMKEIPADERLVLIEDTAEVSLIHENAIGLIAAKGELGEAQIDADDLLQAALRMRPDRIILGEMRGREAQTFLRAVNTGHPGSISTIHADSPEGALEQLALIVLQTGTRLTRDDILHYARTVIDAVVQLERRGGRRQIARIMMTRS